MADSNFLTSLVGLVKGNAPGPGRPLGRLRVSLGGLVQAMAERYGVEPAHVRQNLYLGGSPLRVTSGDRAFLSPAQMRAVGGYERAGTKAKVRYFLPPRRHVLDVLFFDVRQPDDAGGQGPEMTNYDAETGDISTGGSGKGVTFRISIRARGDPTARMQRMARRLVDRFRAWLEGFGWAVSEGIVAKAILESSGPAGRRWMVQVVRESSREEKRVESATGTITYDGPFYSRFKVAHSDIGSVVRAGTTFTQR